MSARPGWKQNQYSHRRGFERKTNRRARHGHASVCFCQSRVWRTRDRRRQRCDVESLSSRRIGLAIDKGEIDAVADAEPIGSLLIAEGKVRNIADQIMDAPYKDEYCCEVVANGKWVDANPDLAARATRALLKGAKWVETNPKAAATLAVEKKYLASTPELNTVALARLRYVPSVQLAEQSLHTAAREMKVAKMLSPETDTEALANRAFMHLPGVTDEWIRDLTVEKVAGGQLSPGDDVRLIAALIQNGSADSCCARKMLDQPDQDAPNLADPDGPCLNKSAVATKK